jgi:hypothetical protein
VSPRRPPSPQHPRIITAVLRPVEDVEALANMSKANAHASVLTLRSQVLRRSDSARRVNVDLRAGDRRRLDRRRSNGTDTAVAQASGSLGGGILGATLSASADPVVTPSTQASSPTQDTDGEQPEWQDTDGEQPE